MLKEEQNLIVRDDMYKLVVKGSWDRTLRFLRKAQDCKFTKSLDKIGRDGLIALKNATPVDSGLASNSWDYIVNYTEPPSIEWHNYDVEGGYNVAILVEYGHGLHQGGYVKGRHFIEPAMRPVFDSAIEYLWKEVNSL